MSRLLSCTLLLLFLVGKGRAQDHYDLHFKVGSATKSLDFSISQIIDARLDRSHCGYLFDAKLGCGIPVRFAGGLEGGIDQLLRSLYDYSGGQQVGMVVREFWMYDGEKSSDLAQLTALFDFYRIRGDRYQKILRVNQYQENLGSNPRKTQQQNAKRVFQQAVAELQTSDWSSTTGPWQSRAEILAEGRSLHIAQPKPLQAGIYLSFREFRQNQPSVKGGTIRIKGNPERDIIDKREVQFKGLGDRIKAKDLSKSIWGFCDGERVYINNWLVFQHASFSPLHSLGDYCPFIGRESAYQLVGSSVGTLVNETPAKRAYVFDATRGQAYLLDEERIEAILSGRGNLLHQYRQERDPQNPRTKIWYISAATQDQR